MKTNAKQRHVTIVGGGVVGMATALYLQREGFGVTVIDRDGPDECCSQGNAGMLGTASCLPISMPGVLQKVPRMLGARGPLRLRWSLLPRLAPWLARFYLAARPARVEAISDGLNALQRHLLGAHLSLLEAAGRADLVRKVGKLHFYETESGYAHGAFARDLQRRHAIPFDEVGPEEVRRLLPGLGVPVHRGLFFPEVAYCVDPLALVRTYVELFVRGGGALKREAVRDIEIGADGPRRIVTDTGGHDVDILVIAAGAWSKPFARRLGARVPLEAQNGYHVMLPSPGIELALPIKPEERSIIITPMTGGIRVTGIADFGGLDGPPDWRRADAILAEARTVFPGLSREVGRKWMGHRPSTPDSLPVIGRSPRYRDAYFAFGHGHFGLGLGAITGRVLAELIAGKAPLVDLTPYRAERFSVIAGNGGSPAAASAVALDGSRGAR